MTAFICTYCFPFLSPASLLTLTEYLFYVPLLGHEDTVVNMIKLVLVLIELTVSRGWETEIPNENPYDSIMVTEEKMLGKVL